MTIVRQYQMIAKDDQSANLHDALVALAAKVRVIEGCEGVALFQDVRTPTRFAFLEYWTSIDAHKAGGKLLGKEAFDPVSATLAEPPQAAYLDQVPLTA